MEGASISPCRNTATDKPGQACYRFEVNNLANNGNAFFGKAKNAVQLDHRAGAAKSIGAVTILVAVGATAMIGMAAFAVETSNWYVQAAELQRIADAAATAGAIKYVKDSGCQAKDNGAIPCYQAAQAYAAMNGVPVSSTRVTIGSSPRGDGNQAVQVTVTKAFLSCCLGCSVATAPLVSVPVPTPRSTALGHPV